jgi:hypothetical protein
MTSEDFQKVKPIKYDLGNGNYVYTVPTVNGLHCWGYVAGEHIQFEEKNIQVLGEKISAYCTEANKTHTEKATKLGEAALKIKENGLEKFAQTDGDHKTDLNWVKD